MAQKETLESLKPIFIIVSQMSAEHKEPTMHKAGTYVWQVANISSGRFNGRANN